MQLAVAFTVTGQREKYLRQTLDSWVRARGSGDVPVIFCVEPRSPMPLTDFTAWVQRSFPAGARVIVNDRRLGCQANTRNAFSRAFAAGADYAIMAEEDIEVATDVLELHAWAASEYLNDSQVTAVCAHARSSQAADPAAVTRACWFNPLVCGTWKDRWESYILPGWGGWGGDPEAWDTNLQRRINADGRQVIFPVMSRALHIGQVSSIRNYELSEHFYQGSRSDCYQPGYPPQQYQEIPFPEHLGLLV